MTKTTFNIITQSADDFDFAPTRGTSGSAGYDLRAFIDEDLTLKPGETALVPTGNRLWINNPAVVGLLYVRSSVGHKRGIVLGNGTGVIDSDYQGELMLSLHNRGKVKQVIERGERIGQIVFTPVIHPIAFNKMMQFQETDRGTGGLGSTGVK